MASHVVNVTEFKAKCLALIEEVSTTGETITVTKRGKPVVLVGPVRKKKFKSSRGLWAGLVTITDEEIDTAQKALWGGDSLRRKLGL